MALIEAINLAQNTVNIQQGDRSESFKLGDVKLYSYAGMDGLTLGQLANAICVHVGVALEDQSVNKMNVITMNARRLKAAAKVLENIVSGAADYATKLELLGYEGMTYGDFLTKVMKLKIGEGCQLPAELNKYSERMQVYAAMKEKVTADATASQQDMIDLQTYLSRRDLAYSTASNLIRHTGMTAQLTSSAMK